MEDITNIAEMIAKLGALVVGFGLLCFIVLRMWFLVENHVKTTLGHISSAIVILSDNLILGLDRQKKSGELLDELNKNITLLEQEYKISLEILREIRDRGRK